MKLYACTNLVVAVDRNCKNMFFLSDFSAALQSSVSGLSDRRPVEREGLTVPKVRLG